MKGFRCLGILLAAGSLAAPALAQSGSAYNLQQRGMNETFRLDVGGFFQKFDTTVRVGDALGNPGTNVPLENTLGTPDSQTNVFVDGVWRLGPHASLQFAYRRARRKGTETLASGFQLADQTYHAGAQLNSSIGLDVGELYYAYALVNSGDAEFGLMLGVSAFYNRISLDVPGPVPAGGGPAGAPPAQSDSRNLFAPVPAVGAYFRYALYPKVFAWGKIRGLEGTASGYHGKMLSWGAGVDLYVTQNVGIGGGYEDTRLLFERRHTRQFGLDYSYSGPTAYVSIAF